MGTIEWVCVAVYLVCAVLTAALVSTSNPKETALICWLGLLWPVAWLFVILFMCCGLCQLFFYTPFSWVLRLGRTKLFITVDKKLNAIMEKISLE